MRRALAVSFALAGVAGWAQTPFFGPGTFPQFRDMSGLSGAGFPVDREGYPTMKGAIALSTPIGFTLGHGYTVHGVASRSRNSRLQWFHTSVRRRASEFDSDATGQIISGFSTAYGNIAISQMIMSTLLDKVHHVQWQLPLSLPGVGVSLGVHNWRDRGNAAGEGWPGDDALSRSVFLVATAEVAPGAYITLGKGDVRYKGVFGSACANLSDRVKAYCEYDTFGWNSGLAFSTGPAKIPALKRPGRPHPEFFITVGYIQGRRATWTLNMVF